MVKLAFWLLLYANSVNCLIKETVKSMNGENYFKYGGDNYNAINLLDNTNCKSIENNEQFYFIKKNYNTTNINCSDGCDTIIEKVKCTSERLENYAYFPKCCPPNYVYETGDHKCALSNITLSDEVDTILFIKSGLENCKVIADFILQNVDDTLSLSINPDRSIYFRNRIYSNGNYCLDNIENSEDFVLRICETIDFCKQSDITGIRCLKKCCPDGHIYKGLECGPVAGYGVPIKKFNDSIRDVDDNFAIITGEKCRKYPASASEFQFYVEKNDSILIPEIGVLKEYLLEESYYCIEHVELGNYVFDTFMLCYIANTQPELRYKFTRTVLLISCVCLFLTIMGYLLLKELRNWIGKLIVCYCTSLFSAFFALTWMQFFPYAQDFCIAAGYTITFSVIAAFTWMNIISYDIWCVLGSMKTQYGNKKHKDRKKFFLYNLYGWSIPIVITSFAAIDNKYSILPQSMHAHIGQIQCMIDKHIEGNYGFHLFMALPCGLLILSNLIIFIKTVCYVLRVKNEIDKMKDLDDTQTHRKRVKKDMERIFMVLRIFIIMGVTWLFEIISAVINFKENSTMNVIEIILDVINCLQGVFIFCIFMLKEKVIYAFAKKIGINKQLRDRSPSTTETMMKCSPDLILRKFH